MVESINLLLVGLYKLLYFGVLSQVRVGIFDSGSLVGWCFLFTQLRQRGLINFHHPFGSGTGRFEGVFLAVAMGVLSERTVFHLNSFDGTSHQCEMFHATVKLVNVLVDVQAALFGIEVQILEELNT